METTIPYTYNKAAGVDFVPRLVNVRLWGESSLNSVLSCLDEERRRQLVSGFGAGHGYSEAAPDRKVEVLLLEASRDIAAKLRNVARNLGLVWSGSVEVDCHREVLMLGPCADNLGSENATAEARARMFEIASRAGIEPVSAFVSYKDYAPHTMEQESGYAHGKA